MENNSDTKFECVSLLKSPKVLSLFFFFILLFLINYHWQYAGSKTTDISNSAYNGFYRVNFKIDRFSGLKFADVYQLQIYNTNETIRWLAVTTPSYDYKYQHTERQFARGVLYVENFLLYGLLLIAVLWVILSWTPTIFRSFKDLLRIKR
jgi:hypothetical protein